MRLGLGLSLGLDRAPGSGVRLLVLLALRGGADVGLAVLVGLLQGPVVAEGDGGGGRCQRGFGEQAGALADLLAVVLLQTVVLQRLPALVVEAVVAEGGGQLAVLGPQGGGQRVEGGLGLLAVLLQGLADEEGRLLQPQPALVAERWFQRSLFSWEQI